MDSDAVSKTSVYSLTSTSASMGRLMGLTAGDSAIFVVKLLLRFMVSIRKKTLNKPSKQLAMPKN